MFLQRLALIGKQLSFENARENLFRFSRTLSRSFTRFRAKQGRSFPAPSLGENQSPSGPDRILEKDTRGDESEGLFLRLRTFISNSFGLIRRTSVARHSTSRWLATSASVALA